jgi:hypothetical protein
MNRIFLLVIIVILISGCLGSGEDVPEVNDSNVENNTNKTDNSTNTTKEYNNPETPSEKLVYDYLTDYNNTNVSLSKYVHNKTPNYGRLTNYERELDEESVADLRQDISYSKILLNQTNESHVSVVATEVYTSIDRENEYEADFIIRENENGSIKIWNIIR